MSIFRTKPIGAEQPSGLKRALGPGALIALGIGAIIGTGFPFKFQGEHVDTYLSTLKAVMTVAAGVRRPGAASLDLAYVAAGRLDGFWEFGLSPWDTAAGTLMIQEAGGRVGKPNGDEYSLGANVIAGNPKVYENLLETLQPLLPESLKH